MIYGLVFFKFDNFENRSSFIKFYGTNVTIVTVTRNHDTEV